MKYYLYKKFGVRFPQITIDPDPEDTPSGGAGGGGSNDSNSSNQPTVTVDNPQALLNAKNRIQAERDQLKAEIREIKDAQRAAETKQLENDREWQTLLQRKEEEHKREVEELKTGNTTTVDKLNKEIEKLKAANTTLTETQTKLQEQIQTTELRESVMRDTLSDMNDELGFDFFWFKEGSNFSRNEKGERLYNGEAFSMESLKGQESLSRYWKKIEAEGAGTDPGHSNSGSDSTKKPGGKSTYEMPRSLQSNPTAMRAWYAENGLDITKHAEYLGSKVKVVDG